MTTPIFPDARLAPYVQYDNNMKAWVPTLPYALSRNEHFLTSITIDVQGTLVWLDIEGKDSQVHGISALNQVNVFKVEFVV